MKRGARRKIWWEYKIVIKEMNAHTHTPVLAIYLFDKLKYITYEFEKKENNEKDNICIVFLISKYYISSIFNIFLRIIGLSRSLRPKCCMSIIETSRAEYDPIFRLIVYFLIHYSNVCLNCVPIYHIPWL